MSLLKLLVYVCKHEVMVVHDKRRCTKFNDFLNVFSLSKIKEKTISHYFK